MCSRPRQFYLHFFRHCGLGVIAAESTKTIVGCIYPPLSKISTVSKHIAVAVAVAVAENAYATGVATHFPKPDDMCPVMLLRVLSFVV